MTANDAVAYPLFKIAEAKSGKAESVGVTCATCKVNTLCLPAGLSPQEFEHVEDGVAARIKVKRGDTLFQRGDRFKNLYVLRTGFVKSQIPQEDGQVRVTGFQMAGDALGLDAIADEVHTRECVAIEDAEVCVRPYAMLERVARQVPSLQRHMHKSMSREIVREGGTLLLTAMHAERRVATFLIDLSERLHARGFSPTELVLRMSREEIGGAVGLKLETVSRTFSQFANAHIVAVQQRYVHILNMQALRRLANACE